MYEVCLVYGSEIYIRQFSTLIAVRNHVLTVDPHGDFELYLKLDGVPVSGNLLWMEDDTIRKFEETVNDDWLHEGF